MNSSPLSTAYRLPKAQENRLRVSRFNRAKRKAYKKYGRVCDKCKATDNLQVHHLNDQSHFPRQRYTIKNLRVLCRDCHQEFHVWMGGFRVKCTRGDYFEWRNKAHKEDEKIVGLKFTSREEASSL